MSVTAFIRRCLGAGMPLDMAMTAAEAFEAEMPVYVPPIRSKGAIRAQRYRDKRDESVTKRDDVTLDVTERDESEPLPLSVSPGPPSTNPNPVPPYNPPKPENVEPDLKAVCEEIWLMQPVIGGKRRSTRPDVLKALKAAVDRRGHDPAKIADACRAYYRLPDCRKDGGQFASGAAVILAEDRWRDFEPKAQPPRPAPKAEPAIYAAHARHFRDTGEWNSAWGPRPNLETAA